MDVNFKLDNRVFNYRVAAIIKNKDKYLVTIHKDKDYLSLIGGRVEIGETSIDAIKREIKEEIGYEVKEAVSLGIIENFFNSSYNNVEYHEILMIYNISLIDDNIYSLDTILNIEGKSDCYKWETLEELKNENLKPNILLKHIGDKDYYHIYNDERNI